MVYKGGDIDNDGEDMEYDEDIDYDGEDMDYDGENMDDAWG